MPNSSASLQHILVTGAGGFVGRALVPLLLARGHRVSVCVRDRAAAAVGTDIRHLGDIGPRTGWTEPLSGIDAVVHLAARVHAMGRQDEAVYQDANVAPTLRLAEGAAAAGVRRLVFLSSVKALGEASHGRPLTEADPPDPRDAYGRSKLAAEQGLAAIAAATGLDVVTLRPPLVHGPGVRANFLGLLRLIDRSVPLPFGAVENRRSLIAVGNLADAIARAVENAPPSTGVYLVADRPPLSTAALIRTLADGMGRRPPLVAVPPGLIRAGAALPVIGPRLARLTGDLDLDDGLFRRTFDWSPPADAATALRETAGWYARTLSGRSRAGSRP